MLQIADIQSINQISLHLLSLLFITTLKGAFVFVIVYLILQTLKNFSPGYKHLLWFFVICGFILIPVISMLAPVFQFNVLRLHKERGELYRIFTSLLWPQINHSEAIHGVAKSDSAISSEIIKTITPGLSWSSWALILWVAGIVSSSLRIIIGRIVLISLSKETHSNVGQRYLHILKTFQKELGITQKVVLLKSTKCNVPFTCNVCKPIIVFPSDIDDWPADRFRVVLTHELAHIRRKDNLTQFIARIICSIFWFMPFVWIAYSNLYFEQEKAADSFVVNTEVKPVDYAEHLLGFARYTRNNNMLAGLFLSRGRKKILEKRIVNVLSFERNNALSRGLKTRTKDFILIALLISAFIALLGSCATTKKAISTEDLLNALSGTWVNAEYEYKGDSGPHQKIVIYPDGKYEFYGLVSHDTPGGKGTFSIMDRWTDSKGTIWYRCRGRDLCLKGTFYEVGKISDSGKYREIIVSASEITIDEWDSPLHTHRFYFSQYKPDLHF
jgi:beta-lactamase regulating signal transducer with metallopeptidase domain